ncbi:MAG TPA: ATP-binding protein, partial [Thermoanaerobaculia bacterium]|nr:ATP-binding protein [Thermoanaerobaculia bacterium]
MTETASSTGVTTPADPKTGTRPDGLDPRLAEQLRQAQRALLSRPRASIRTRLVTTLALCLGLCTLFSIAALNMLGKVRAKLALLKATEELAASILETRALEGEGALTTLQSRRVLGEVRTAVALFRRAADAAPVAEAPSLTLLVDRLETYQRLLEANQALVDAEGGDQASIPVRGEIVREKELEVARILDGIIRRERASATQLLEVAEKGPLVLLALLIVFFGAISYTFVKALVAPIRRFQGYTGRIAAGDFSFIRPARAYRDEFTDLAVAVNEMLAQVQAQQNRLVKGAKLAAVGTLTSGIAHELNNPLNNIAITTEALLEELPKLSDEEKWRLLQDVYFETERAGEIVKSLLDFTRQEKPELVRLDLGEVIQSTVRLAQNEMAIHNVSFLSDLPAGLPPVRGTSNQLRQVFLNLFLNAIQAMPAGGTLSVSAAPGEDKDQVCVDVRDDGAGIPPEVLPRVFDPFFTTKDPGQGTGLGLSVSLGIVRKFGGDIQIMSEPGKG